MRIKSDYAITELHARAGDWMVDRPLSELHLTKEGVVVLGVHRADGVFTGAPNGDTIIRNDDEVVAYGRIGTLQDLASRPASSGDTIHRQKTVEHSKLLDD